jgi:hypothetical protein
MMQEYFTLAVPAQQCAEIASAVPTLRQAAEFELLKNRMLLCALDETPEMELHISIIHAGREAASLAWQTPFPLLVYPGLFEEKAHAARERALRQACVHQKSLELLAFAGSELGVSQWFDEPRGASPADAEGN